MLKQEIISGEIMMKDYFSKDFTSLLDRLLDRNENTRATIDQVKVHPFFKKIDWNAVNRKEIVAKPPFQPKINKKTFVVTTRDSLQVKQEANLIKD